jgi:pimeloyl-ACP methyl ester carboxylesterase
MIRWESSPDSGLCLRGRRTAGPGDDDKPTLHFLSGNGFCGGVYWPMLSKLLPDHGLFLHDIEGQGESDAPPRFSGVKTLLARTRAVIGEQGLANPGSRLIGMGHSFGAALTLRIAAANPGLFRALVLLDPIALPTPAWLGVKFASAFGRHPMSKAALRRRTSWNSREAALSHLRNRGIYQGWTEEAIVSFVDHAMTWRDGRYVLRCPVRIEADIFEHPLYCWRAFARVDVPILFLRGANSYPFFPWAERKAARCNPRVEVRQLPGGHCFMQEDPQASADAVRAFLGKHGL